jgi:hypothetical protein
MLPRAEARPAPAFERRLPDMSLMRAGRMPAQASSRRAAPFVIAALLFVVASAACWFGFRHYIYDDQPAPRAPAPVQPASRP